MGVWCVSSACHLIAFTGSIESKLHPAYRCRLNRIGLVGRQYCVGTSCLVLQRATSTIIL